MTSLAFILGVVPLMLSHGAGAEMRRTLGTAVFSGMLGVTLFGIFLTPVFFFVIDWLSETRLFALAAGPLRSARWRARDVSRCDPCGSCVRDLQRSAAAASRSPRASPSSSREPLEPEPRTESEPELVEPK